MGADALLAVGLSYRTAPVNVRERLAVDDLGVHRTLANLVSSGVSREALLISTCNRVELYTVPGRGGESAVAEFFSTFRGPEGEPLDRYLYWHRGREAVQHLFRVSSALDSMVLGEPQILGQVKEAVRQAQEANTLGRVLHRLTQRSLAVGKRVRTETALGQHRVGIGNAGVDLATQIFGDLRGRRAMLIGVGEMGRQVANALQTAGLHELVVCNRTWDRARELAEIQGGTAIEWGRLGEYLGRVDIAIAATGATEPVLRAADVRSALRARNYRPLLLVDLSVPRNIASDVDGIEDAYLFNVDHLRDVQSRGKALREEAAQDAHALVDDETDRFMTSLAELDVSERIGGLVRHFEAVRAAEIERSGRLVAELDDEQREALDAMSRALVKKVLHQPLQALRQAAREGDAERVEAILHALGEEDA
ncbi:MAG: glutamyl-tRNA reductase [Deltaproteobacteria bacterium]|nr:MAG: glutamyl-tRNA reductase [Deltaproteobacteria bacterium]